MIGGLSLDRKEGEQILLEWEGRRILLEMTWIGVTARKCRVAILAPAAVKINRVLPGQELEGLPELAAPAMLASCTNKS